MNIVCLGKVVAAVAGTPVRVTSTVTPCRAILAQSLDTNTGKVYLGLAGLVKATYVQVIRSFPVPVPAAGVLDYLFIDGCGGNPLRADDYYVDAAVSGEGFVISLYVE